MTLKTQRLLTRARKIANKGEIEEAEKIYSMILEASPENKEAKDELSALKHHKVQQEPPQEKIHSVISLFTNNQIQEALDDVKTLINGYPNSAILYNIQASCCFIVLKMNCIELVMNRQDSSTNVDALLDVNI